MVVDGEGVPRFDQNTHQSTHTTSYQDHSGDESDTDTSTSDISNTSSKCEAVQQPHDTYPIEIGSFCTTDAGVDATLCDLHSRLKHGDRRIQLTIDTYLIACACEQSLPWHTLQQLRPSETNVPQYHTLPDITRFISSSFTSDPVTGIISYYIQMLSPLKRKSRTRRGNPAHPQCHVEASVCLNLIQATLLGLYPRSSKQPIWRTRVAIAGCIYKLHTAPFEKQCQFLTASHDLLRLCFTEYIINMRADFCLVEHDFLANHASFLPTYDTACITLCDHVRQTCVQSVDWSWANINTVCMSSLDRVSRMCRTQLIPVQAAVNYGAIRPAHIQIALGQHMVCTDSRTNGHTYTTTTELIHQTVTVYMLPWNLVTTQAARIVDKFSDALFPVLTACEKHICIRCAHGTNSRMLQRVSKLRMDTQTMHITCANCKSEDTVVKINVFGKLLCIRNVYYFGCQECTSLHVYNPESPLTCTRLNMRAAVPLLDCGTTSLLPTSLLPTSLLPTSLLPTSLLPTSLLQTNKLAQSQVMMSDDVTSKIQRNADRKNRCKWCGRICSARTIQLLHTASASMVSVTLCFKHFPAVFMLKMITDTDSFVRYTIDTINNTTKNANRSKIKKGWL
jgi:hypothetical protein